MAATTCVSPELNGAAITATQVFSPVSRTQNDAEIHWPRGQHAPIVALLLLLVLLVLLVMVHVLVGGIKGVIQVPPAPGA